MSNSKEQTPQPLIEITKEGISVLDSSLKVIYHYVHNDGIEMKNLPDILKIILETLKSVPNLDEILYLVVDPFTLESLYFAKKISKKKIRKAYSDHDEQSVTIYNVNLFGKKYTLKVIKQIEMTKRYGSEHVVPVCKEPELEPAPTLNIWQIFLKKLGLKKA